MSTTSTARLGLLKPDAAELVNPVAQIGGNMQKIDDGVALVGHAHTGTAGDGPPIQASGLADSAVSDPKIGDRTVDPALANPASTGTLTQLLSWIVGRLLAMSGAGSWLAVPATTLAAAKAHADSKAGHVPNGQYTAYTSSATQEPAWADISGKPSIESPAGAQAKADTAQAVATEEGLVVEAVSAVNGSEPAQVQTTMGSAVEFANAVTQSVTWNRVFPFGANACKLELRLAADVANAGNFRVRVAYQVNGGAATNVDVTVTPGNDVLLHTADLGIIVPDASVNGGDLATFTLSRLGADALDTHTGKMRIYQTRLRRG